MEKQREERPRQTSSTLLTPRQLQIVTLLAEGMSNSEIAQALGLSVGTVESHLDRIYRKLGVHSRTLALVVALRLGGVGKETGIPVLPLEAP